MALKSKCGIELPAPEKVIGGYPDDSEWLYTAEQMRSICDDGYAKAIKDATSLVKNYMMDCDDNDVLKHKEMIRRDNTRYANMIILGLGQK